MRCGMNSSDTDERTCACKKGQMHVKRVCRNIRRPLFGKLFDNNKVYDYTTRKNFSRNSREIT